MSIDVPKTPEQVIREREAVFESWLRVDHNGIKKINFATAPKPGELAQVIVMYEQHKPYAHSNEHDMNKTMAEADKFKRLSGGYDIEDFLAYQKRRGEESQK